MDGVTINWFFLIIAALLLLPPPYLSRTQKKSILDPRRHSSTRFGALFGAWQNWTDLIRALAGTVILLKLAISIAPEIKGAGTRGVLVEAVVLGLGCLIQVVRVGRYVYSGIQFLGPIFYLTGVTMALAGPYVGGFAVFTGWLFALGGGNIAYQIPVMAVALGVGGVFFGLSLDVILNGALIFAPLILEFLFRKRLLYIAAKSSIPVA